MIARWVLWLLLLAVTPLFAQTDESVSTGGTAQVTLTLNNMQGGFYANMGVVFKNRADGAIIKGRTGANGMLKIDLPAPAVYEVTMENNPVPKVLKVSAAGMKMGTTYTYDPGMASFNTTHLMDADELKLHRARMAALPDTTWYHAFQATSLKPTNQLAFFRISIKDFDGLPLVGETITVSTRNYHKVFMGVTKRSGTLVMLLPKGDTLDISFKYDRNYKLDYLPPKKGMLELEMDISYIGTAELERQKQLELARLEAEKKRVAKERKALELEAKKLGITVDALLIKRWKESYSVSDYEIVDSVFGRHPEWKEKLIVCDLTGSMSPYSSALSVWYKLNYLKEQNLQFVFFNDGDEKADEKKVIGNTGGIYYAKSKGLDSLVWVMSKVAAAGSGGDCPENNIEALLKGTKMAAAYGSLIMIADNNAPVKDIELLKQFKVPVKIIVCGATTSIHPDYLLIAYKTGGSVHTIEKDITNLARLAEGQTITIKGITYRLMNGRFVAIKGV